MIKDLDFLRTIDIFCDMPTQSLEGLAGIFNQTTAAEDEVIFREDDLNSHLYLLKQGKVKISKHKHDASVPDGEELVLMLHPKEAFGELSFMDGRRRSATAKATQASLLYTLSREDFQAFAVQDPRAAYLFIYNLAVVITNRLRDTDILWLGG